MTRRKAITAFVALAVGTSPIACHRRRHSMRPSDSETEFRRFIATTGASLVALDAAAAIRLMLAFYRGFRADDCPIDENGDMLLYQWGIYDWGQGETFNFGITRQFILAGGEGDGGMSQLALTLHFTPTETLRALGNKAVGSSADADRVALMLAAAESSTRWCKSLSEVDVFEKFIRDSTAFREVTAIKPARVELDWSEV